MVRLDIVSLLGLSCLVPFTHCYAIDASCGDHDFVQQAAERAFGYAANALTVLEQPRSPNVNRLISLLFCKDGEDAATKDTTEIGEVFEGIATFSTKKDYIEHNFDSDTQNEVVSMLPNASWNALT